MISCAAAQVDRPVCMRVSLDAPAPRRAARVLRVLRVRSAECGCMCMCRATGTAKH